MILFLPLRSKVQEEMADNVNKTRVNMLFLLGNISIPSKVQILEQIVKFNQAALLRQNSQIIAKCKKNAELLKEKGALQR